MADHEDYLPGEAPLAHAASHEDLGSDEISVAGLSGELADDQPAKAHDLGGAKHNADTLANLNAKVNDATLDDSGDPRDPNAHKASHEFGGSDQISVDALSGLLSDAQYPLIHPLGGDAHQADILADLNSKVTDATLEDKTVLENTMDAKVATHAALPTVHQDAPALIETHRLAAGAHHAKYTDAEAVAAIYAAKPCFSAKLTATVSNVTGDGTAYSITGAIWTEINDSGSNFSNGTFTAPASGIYLFSGIFAISGLAAAHTQGNLDLMTSNRTYLLAICNFAAIAVSGNVYLPFSVYADMDAADTAYLRLRVYNGTKIVDLALNTFFGCSRII